MPPLLCNRVLDSPFPPRFFASFSLATTYLKPNLVGFSIIGSLYLWHYSIHLLCPFCQRFPVNSLKTSTIIHLSASHISNMSVLICLSSSFLVSFSVICTLTSPFISSTCSYSVSMRPAPCSSIFHHCSHSSPDFIQLDRGKPLILSNRPSLIT